MGISNSVDLTKTSQKLFQKFKIKNQDERETEINRMLFVQGENNKKQIRDSNQAKRIYNIIRQFRSGNQKCFNPLQIQEALDKMEDFDWYEEIFQMLLNQNFKKKKNSKKFIRIENGQGTNYTEIFQLIESFYLLCYLMVHVNISQSIQYKTLININHNFKTFQDIPSLNFRKQSIGNVSYLMDQSLERNNSHIFNQRMNFQDFSISNQKNKVQGITKRQTTQQKIYYNKHGNFIVIQKGNF